MSDKEPEVTERCFSVGPVSLRMVIDSRAAGFEWTVTQTPGCEPWDNYVTYGGYQKTRRDALAAAQSAAYTLLGDWVREANCAINKIREEE